MYSWLPTYFVQAHGFSLKESGIVSAIPNLAMVRPGDANETAYAWKAILENPEGPKGIALTRQNIPVLEGTSADGVARGGYVLADASNGAPELVIIGTGFAGSAWPRSRR